MQSERHEKATAAFCNFTNGPQK